MDGRRLTLLPRLGVRPPTACRSALAGVLAAALLPQAAWATLGGRPGQTDLQSETGEAVQTVCGFFARGETPVENDLQQDLFDRCREMVHTANDLDDAQPSGDSLGLSEEELAAGLQQLASEEAAAAGTVSLDTSFGQLSNLLTRLGNLRGGGAGLAVAGLGLGTGGPWPTHLAGTGTPSGGSAGIGDEGRLGFFVNGSLGFGDTDASDREDAFDFDTYALTAGLDYRLSDQAVLGAAVGYADLDADFDSSATVAGGDLGADGYSLSAYGTWYSGAFYVDGIVSYGSNDYDLTRRIVYQSNTDRPSQDLRADSSTDSDQWLLSAGAGYDLQYGAATLTPYGRLTYLDAEVDGYRETGARGLNLEVESQDLESLRSVLGAQATTAITRSFGILLPLARLEWHHEFEDGERTLTARYVNDPNRIPLVARTDELDSDFFVLGLGVSTVYKGGSQAFLTYETALGLKDVTSHAFTAGVRFAF